MRLAAALVLSVCVALAQNGADRPSFEAASVKPANADPRGLGPLRGGPGTSSPGQLTGVASLKALLMRAWQLKEYQISGPAWMASERYEIAAKIPEDATKRQVSLMLASLLVERFGLETHRETRELPMYALAVAKSGPKFRPSDPNDAADPADATIFSPKFIKGADGFPDIAASQKMARSYEMVIGGTDGILYKLWAHRETMDQLADRLGAQLSRPVVDETRLKDVYDFALTWSVETAGGVIPRTGPPPDSIDMHNSPILSDPGLSIFTALPSQLGLKLEARRGPVEMLVVDKAAKVPAAN
jgi:uncharacterized protein (TIGR03435 family)